MNYNISDQLFIVMYKSTFFFFFCPFLRAVAQFLMVIDLQPFHYVDKNVHEKDKVGASSKAAEEGKDEEHYQHFDKIAKRVRWQLINGEENSWDLYVKVPDAVQKRWMDMFLKPDNHNQESNPPGMK